MGLESKRRSGRRMNARQGLMEGGDIRGAHQAFHLLPVFQQDQGRPELDAITAPQGTARSVFDLDVAPGGVLCQRSLNGGLGCATVAAPVGAEFEHHTVAPAAHLGGGGGFGLTQIGCVHGHGRMRVARLAGRQDLFVVVRLLSPCNDCQIIFPIKNPITKQRQTNLRSRVLSSFNYEVFCIL